uniref:Linker for activation of T-cells family member 1 n=1 Tax=Caenorhabditis tropicalis TaxID=1561998 RepID=A0A1I7TR93_9PELO
MEALYEASDPVGAVCEEDSIYCPPSYPRNLPAKEDNTSYEELQTMYERAEEVHIGPAAAHTAPSSRDPSAPIVGGAPSAQPAPQPVANVAIIAALNNGVACERAAASHDFVSTFSHDNVSDDESNSSVSLSEWEEESSSEEEFE